MSPDSPSYTAEPIKEGGPRSIVLYRPVGALGSYHAHPDARVFEDPLRVSHERYFVDGKDVSDYSMPSGLSEGSNLPGEPGDIQAARDLPGVLLDAYQLYLYQGDGCVWTFRFPCAANKNFDYDPSAAIGVPNGQLRAYLRNRPK